MAGAPDGGIDVAREHRERALQPGKLGILHNARVGALRLGV